MSDLIWMPVLKVLSEGILALRIKYLFDWDRKVWVEHPDNYPTDPYNPWHSQFLCREVDGKSQFWLIIVPATAKLMSEFGLRDEHLLKAIEPKPPWPSKVVMFYMDGQIAAGLVEHPPAKSTTPEWWFKEPPPTRFEREDVI